MGLLGHDYLCNHHFVALSMTYFAACLCLAIQIYDSRCRQKKEKSSNLAQNLSH